jgi:hypothetical protein
MQEANWKIFAAKFNAKEQSSFEWFSYLLFCDEFNKPTGMLRYKNQAGIETEPIQHDGKTLGFQAKYYETKIIRNKKDIKDSFKKAKDRNPTLNKIIFYINQEFSESSKKEQKDPKYKIEIEKYASSIGIEIEWKSKSFFESLFVCEKNAAIAKHFFSPDKSIIDFIGELTRHTQSILTPIHSNIQLKGTEIKLDRSKTIGELIAKFDDCSLVILSGEAGVGKTALVKDYYEMAKDSTPFFVFKATEFNIPNINELFGKYGPFTFRDFIEEYQAQSEKIIVIDSAEKLSDFDHREVFYEFLSELLEENWKVLITTRYGYIDALEFQITEINRTVFRSIVIKKLKHDDLHNLAKKYNFNLPPNTRLLELLTTPFYLNEYLRTSNNIDETTNYDDFKDALWKKQIVKIEYQKNNAHIKRAECFLKIAINRANTGHLVVDAVECDDETLRSLDFDEIIKHDPVAGGYFITHDIYEEWALDRIIERAFYQKKDYNGFLQDIGTSLPIRRALRNWLSEKLCDDIDKVKELIEYIITDDKIASYWQDEICISVLLSSYAGKFVQLFTSKLLEDNQRLLLRLVFLLRIACKEIDEDFLTILGITRTEQNYLNILFTKPKGNGWDAIVQFILDHKGEIALKNASIIIPLLDDWNNKNKNGGTTKRASLIALYYYNNYNEIVKISEYRYSSRDQNKEQLIRVILNGASEITEELKIIFHEVISTKLTNYRDKYYDIIETILGSITDGSEVTRILPGYVIQLADIFWFQPPDQEEKYHDYSLGVEPHFCLSEKLDNKYFPSSALQTPIFQLLNVAPVETVKFILSFTNRAIECYRKSELGNEASEVKIFFTDNENCSQYISSRLWNMYRGTHVSTDLLQSIHMALERWLLIIAKNATSETIESWCLYLLKNTQSTSITAIVTSICLAYPSKLFNVASILFKTKEFFFYDTERMIRDQHAKGTYSIGYGFNYKNELYQNERIKTCDDLHRRLSLEHLAFKYQVEIFEGESDDGIKHRQEIIGKIIDSHYDCLPEQSIETDADKTWRLCLARIDTRKMKTEVEENNGNVVVKFNPQIDPNLRKYSEDSVNSAIAATKHTPLQLWANYRFKKNHEYRQYKTFEDNPKLVIEETREIIKHLEKGDDPFPMFNNTIPPYTCSVLIRDFGDKITTEDKIFCRDIIIQYAKIPLTIRNYRYQSEDGTEPSISTLPILIQHFPEKVSDIKSLLMLLLFNPWGDIVTFATRGIVNQMWAVRFDDAQALFLGCLLLRPKYIALRKEVTKENRQMGIFNIQETPIMELFNKKYENELNKISTNKITFTEMGDLSNLDFTTLEIAFELIPPNTYNTTHKDFLNVFLPLYAKILRKDRDEDKVDYSLRQRFLKKITHFILCSPKDDIQTYLQPFVDNFTDSRDYTNLFQEFISAEDKLNHYDEFWLVWNYFYAYIVKTFKNNRSHYSDEELIHNYLLAWPYWKKNIKEWHTLKEREKDFYKRISEDLGHHPSVLYSISKILNDIGSSFIDDGIVWLSNILQNNPQYTSIELETNTLYYFENIMRRFILINRQKIKTTLILRDQVIIILNFLFEKGSTAGFLLREDIL